jgi:acyl-CoA synthetase (AMP-forming)/AMP-acid ligase II
VPRRFTRESVGVTEEMIHTFGEIVFRMSHNLQERVGDPVRALDFVEIERQREAMGLADGQIAERLGLTTEQVTCIRNTEESRRYRTDQQAYLLELGGGRRFRPEAVVRLEDRTRYGDDALRLREAFDFDPELARRYVERGWWGDDTLIRWLAHHTAERPDAPAVVCGTTAISWRALSERVARVAEGLRGAGVGRGEVVAVQLPNVPEFVVAYLAICRLGAVTTTIHMPYRGAEIEALLRHSRARAMICLSQAKDWSPAEVCLGLRGAVPTLRTVIGVGLPVRDALAFADLESAPAVRQHMVEPPVAADPFLLLYTSGTTSAPKGVPHNYHTILSNARLGVTEHGLTAADRILSAAPLTHLFGLYALHCAWASGATSILLPTFTPLDLAGSVERDEPTALWAGPAHIAACRALGLLDSSDWSSLKLVILSGSACPPELVHDLSARLPGAKVTQLWGMTETQGALYTRPQDPPEIAERSAGRPSPGTEIRVVDSDGTPCVFGAEGELQVRGCLLFPGFYDNPSANESAFTPDRWYRTGDLATMDASGNVAITGRLRDVINRGGVKFNPRDVEELLDSHPKILQSAIVPMPDPVLGERACCFVTLRPGATGLTLEEISAFLIERRIAKIKLPERLVIVSEMPLTPTRKIIKARLKIPEGAALADRIQRSAQRYPSHS